MKKQREIQTECAHCHQPVSDPVVGKDGERTYCCYGCMVVDDLLGQNGPGIAHEALPLKNMPF
ncbi:MAG: hypothetical protein U5L96_14555 [Owenweeksia sp.]|nr:hypothetical protein [Owenweeksia sp.]